MTPAQTRAHGLVTPSPLDHWIDAMLRAFVELVRNVVSTLWMNRRRPPAECHSDATPAVLPGATNDTQSGNQPAATNSQPPLALMVSSARSARPSNHEGVLTHVSYKLPRQRDSQLSVPLIPAKAGIQERSSNPHGIEAPRRNKPPSWPWIPAFAGMSGDGVMMQERVRPAS
jgi:hypothetical protein